MKISCIIPTLARGPVLVHTIRLLLRQTFPAYEIIIVDQTREHSAPVENLLERWRQGKRIQWLRQTETNASRARNSGALAASGDVLLFLDDDIVLGPSLLERYARTFRRTRAPGVCGQILEGDRHRVHRLPRAVGGEFGWLLYFPKNYDREIVTSFMMSGNVAIRRDIFLALGGMDENFEKGAFREESDFAVRFRRAGYRFIFSPQCGIYHLGAGGVPGGGSRHWNDGRDFRYFHHCVGDWYFNLKHARAPGAAARLLYHSLRCFVVNRARLRQPLRMFAAFLFWAAALPVAFFKLSRGPVYCTGRRGGVFPPNASHSRRPNASVP